MRPSPPPRPWRIRRRLLGLVALPLVLGVAMAAVQAADQYHLTRQSEALADGIERAVRLGVAVDEVEAESGASLGVGTLRELGWTRAEAQGRLGYDAIAELAAARRDLDVQLARLDRGRLSGEAVDLLEQLPAIREDVDGRRIDPADAVAYYRRLTMTLGDGLAAELRRATESLHDLDGNQALVGDLELIRELHQLAGASARWLVLGARPAMEPSPELALDLAGAVTAQDELIADLDRRHPELAADPRWVSASSGGADRRRMASEVLELAHSRFQGTDRRAEVASDLRRVAVGERRRLDRLSQLGDERTAELRRSAAALGADARTRLLLTVGVAAAALLAVAVLALRTAGSIARHVEALRLRAAAVTAGEVPPASIDARRAPLEVLEAERALQGLLDALQLLGVQAEALAAGDLDDPSLAQRVPGPLGAALGGTLERLRGVNRDLRRSEEQARGIVEAAAEAILVVDDRGLVLMANSAAHRLFGSPELDGTDLTAHLGRTGLAELVDGEVLVRRPDGEQVPVLVSTSTLDDDAGALTVVVCRDIGDRKRLEQRLAHQAVHDPLTGLWNRVGLIDHLQERMAAGVGVGLVYLDLDRFKLINDNHGHLLGDEVLVEVARRLRQGVRPDDRVARLGGDEFVVATALEPGRDLLEEHAELTGLAERLLRLLLQPIDTAVGPLRVAGSAGIAVGGDGMAPLELLRRADVALYEAKGAGRARSRVFAADIEAEDERRRRVERELRSAIAGDELLLEYQPVVALDSGRIVGLEALVRWDHPTRGLLPPDEFVPVAERSGLVLELDRWVLRRAVRDLATLADDPDTRDWVVAVNVSARHLAEGRLTTILAATLDRYGIDGRRLELEITESYVLADWLSVLPCLQELQRLGVSLALDDFGTGYSNLTHLLRLPVRTIKIDRSFVSSLDRTAGRGIVAALVRFARIGGLRVVAEGIEQPSELEALLAMGCELGQGHLFAPSAPLAQLVAEGRAQRTRMGMERGPRT